MARRLGLAQPAGWPAGVGTHGPAVAGRPPPAGAVAVAWLPLPFRGSLTPGPGGPIQATTAGSSGERKRRRMRLTGG